MSKQTSVAGRKRNDGIDFYQTPEWAIKALLTRIDINNKKVVEPCCGNGAIAKLIPNCVGFDIRTDDNVWGIKGKNIFEARDKCCDIIITNPPYFCAQEIIEKSLNMAKDRVYMLLKLQFLESSSRYEFFQNTPLKNVYVFCKRITMYPGNDEKPKNSGQIAYAWYEWEHGYNGKPMIEWIK